MASGSYNTGYEIAAYITLSKDRAQNGNPLILVANNIEEQKQITIDISRALRAEVVQLNCGDYMVITKK
ncbi:capping complex subunit for YIEGIA [Candidatus Clostridium radicumherbarum]|uniref:Capping complex subunit for YIEGIA n=1 Tax=Candidatus Clostridium radicumherbarum TaxID=3381662 RepID=A0ABW8TRL3_9CLOT